MYVINTKNNITSNRALVVPTKEWRRLKDMITEKKDYIAELKKIKNERQAASMAITESWPTTTKNQRKKEMEKRQQLLADAEAAKTKRDEEIKLKILKRRNEIVEKVQAKKWSEKDSVKATTKAMHYIEVLRERDMQIKFNEAEKTKILEEERLLKIKQNLEADQYRKDLWEKKLRHEETKKANAAVILKELKERKVLRHNLDLQLRQEGKAESQRIAKEIEKDIKEKKAKDIAEREKSLKYLNESRDNFVQKNKFHKMKEQKEDLIISILDESRNKITKIKKYKEIQLLKEKHLRSDKIAKMTLANQTKKINTADRVYQDAIEEKEKQYINEENRKKELAEKIKKDLLDFKNHFDELKEKENERMALSSKWESERQIKETNMFANLIESNKRKKIHEMKCFRENLDAQCDNNIMASVADKNEEFKQYNLRKNEWRLEDQKFMTYTKKLINKYKEKGVSVVPLIKSIKDYEKKNKLL